MENFPDNSTPREAPLRIDNSLGGNPTGKGKRMLLIGLIVVAVLLIGAGIFYLVGSSKTLEITASPTPVSASQTTSPEATPSPSPLEKSDISIEVQNGTGIAKDASFVEGILKKLGFSDIKVGNASSQDHTQTTVSYKKEVSSEFISEIITELKKSYTNVVDKESSSIETDIQIITGSKKGQTTTPKPATTSTPTGTASPKASPTASPKPTATP